MRALTYTFLILGILGLVLAPAAGLFALLWAGLCEWARTQLQEREAEGDALREAVARSKRILANNVPPKSMNSVETEGQ